MTDTPRTKAELKTQFADNTSREITPQFLRDLVESVVLRLDSLGDAHLFTMEAGVANPASAHALSIRSEDPTIPPLEVAGDNGDGNGLRELFSIENNNPGPPDGNFRNMTLKVGDTNPAVQKHGIGPLRFFSRSGDSGNYWAAYLPGSSTVVVAYLSAGGSLVLNVGGVSSNAIVVQTFGDANAKYIVKEDGKLFWGPGGGTAVDVSLERSAANVLSMGAGDALRHPGTSHGSLPAASGYAAGSQTYCITDKQPLWSDGSAWYEADGSAH